MIDKIHYLDFVNHVHHKTEIGQSIKFKFECKFHPLTGPNPNLALSGLASIQLDALMWFNTGGEHWNTKWGGGPSIPDIIF